MVLLKSHTLDFGADCAEAAHGANLSMAICPHLRKCAKPINTDFPLLTGKQPYRNVLHGSDQREQRMSATSGAPRRRETPVEEGSTQRVVD